MPYGPSVDTMGIKASQSTIDRNGAGGDAGVTEKRNAAMALLAKIKQSGMPADPDAARFGVEGGHAPQSGKAATKKAGTRPDPRGVVGGQKKQ